MKTLIRALLALCAVLVSFSAYAESGTCVITKGHYVSHCRVETHVSLSAYETEVCKLNPAYFKKCTDGEFRHLPVGAVLRVPRITISAPAQTTSVATSSPLAAEVARVQSAAQEVATQNAALRKRVAQDEAQLLALRKQLLAPVAPTVQKAKPTHEVERTKTLPPATATLTYTMRNVEENIVRVGIVLAGMFLAFLVVRFGTKPHNIAIRDGFDEGLTLNEHLKYLRSIDELKSKLALAEAKIIVAESQFTKEKTKNVELIKLVHELDPTINTEKFLGSGSFIALNGLSHQATG